MAQRCSYLSPEGSACRAYATKSGRGLCFLHDPANADAARIAQKKGGLLKVVRVGELVEDLGWPKQIHLRRPRDVRRFVSQVMNEVRAGKVEPGLANSLFVGANVLLKSFDCEAVDRLEALEQAAKERGLFAGQ